MADYMKKDKLPFYTDGNRVFRVEMSIKVDETGEWLSPEQVEKLEIIHDWARHFIHASNKLIRTKKLFRTVESPSYFDEPKSSVWLGKSVTSVPVGIIG